MQKRRSCASAHSAKETLLCRTLDGADHGTTAPVKTNFVGDLHDLRVTRGTKKAARKLHSVVQQDGVKLPCAPECGASVIRQEKRAAAIYLFSTDVSLAQIRYTSPLSQRRVPSTTILDLLDNRHLPD